MNISDYRKMKAGQNLSGNSFITIYCELFIILKMTTFLKVIKLRDKIEKEVFFTLSVAISNLKSKITL